MLDANMMNYAFDLVKSTENQLAALMGRPVKVWFDFTNGKLSTEMIVSVVCSCCNISQTELMSLSKADHIVFARYHCFNLMSRFLQMNKTEISIYFKKNHATVINGLHQFDTMYETSKPFREQSQFIEKSLLTVLSSNETAE